ncbi:hypothetical protein [Pseudanabaena sp. 'Roaring Creek']|uniref:hypothetical protein n=1 Tax=Pseudanabaena sp. 'Roaring Creek' TaxID=1681830 RepID=UPI000AD599BB|nr:hypothetical protein [Pseudanabaena sp. 'Roaring Creek']
MSGGALHRHSYLGFCPKQTLLCYGSRRCLGHKAQEENGSVTAILFLGFMLG